MKVCLWWNSDQPEMNTACDPWWVRIKDFNVEPGIHETEDGRFVTNEPDLVTCEECAGFIGT